MVAVGYATTMIGKTLSRQMERLEAEVLPGEEYVVVLHVRGVTSEGDAGKSREFTVRMLSGKTKHQNTPRRAVPRAFC
jgi:hypothetical protein